MTQLETIHNHLKEGSPITKIGSLKEYGILNLGDIILKLRKIYGYDYIITQMLPGLNSGRRYAAYKINTKHLIQAS